MTAVEAPAGRLGLPADDTAKAEPDDLQLWSVTTIIGALDRPALMYWSAEQAALAAVHSTRTWQAMLDDDEPDCPHDSSDCAAVKWLRDARFRKPKGVRSATQLGTDVHAACEAWALTGERPPADDEVNPFLDRFGEWADRFQPEYIATEVMVASPLYGYGGTCDGFFKVGGTPLIFDIKTSRKATDSRGQQSTPYPETALQLAAYRYAEMAAVWRPRRVEKFRRRLYLLSPEEQAMAVPVPQVDGGVCVHITPAACEAFPVRCDEQIHEAFLYVLEAARWQFDASKDAIGQPLEEEPS